MKKTIKTEVIYERQIDITEPDRDRIGPIVYLNVFRSLKSNVLYGWKEYDYFRNGNIKSKEWNFRDRMNVSFVPKDNCIHTYGEPIVVVQRLNKI